MQKACKLQVAQLLHEHQLTALPVITPEGLVAGVVSEADLLRKQEPDANIAAEARAVLTGILLADPPAVRVSVHSGVVTLAGRLASQEQIDAAVRLTDAIDAVVAVTSELHAPAPENWPGAGYHIPA